MIRKGDILMFPDAPSKENQERRYKVLRRGPFRVKLTPEPVGLVYHMGQARQFHFRQTWKKSRNLGMTVIERSCRGCDALWAGDE